ncbi:MAG: pre-peptidase C-terminal domain-containing protein [Verrucomicrobiota bacterium]
MRRLPALLLATLATSGFAQEKAPAIPRLTAMAPLEVVPGVTTTLRLRGIKLNETRDLEFLDVPSQPGIEIREKKNAEIPNGLDAKEAGDTQLEIKLTVPADWQPGTVRFRIVSGSERTDPCKLHVIAPASLIEEKEPNGSFREAQPIDCGKVVRGMIKEEKDVDVFQFTGRARTTIWAGIVAVRHASLLDSALHLYDSAGQLLAANDDSAADRDASLHFRIPADGTYFLTVTDANDRGGQWNAFELILKELP